MKPRKHTMTKSREPQTVAAAEQTLAMLQEKRASLVTRGAELDERRRFAAYAAHAQLDPAARNILGKINGEVGVHGSELRSVDDAISEAQTKLTIAKAYEADVADQAKARAIMEIVGVFREAGREMDDAARTLGEMGKLLGNLLGQLRAAGITSPSHEQLDVLGGQALQTAILATPWGKRYEHLAPGQRQTFRALVDGWAEMIESRVKAQLGKQEEEAA